jgi:dienelactone hydrolase
MRLLLLITVLCSTVCGQQTDVMSYPRALRDPYQSDFPMKLDGLALPEGWPQRARDIRDRILLSAGLLPLPTKTPLNAVVHGRVERADYTIERVYFESFPGHFVTGNLYQPKVPSVRPMPGILCPHGHWKDGRFYFNDDPAEDLAIGSERWESGARAPLQARCVQLARMGCVVFHFDTLGNADSMQIAEHRSGRRVHLDGERPGEYGLYSAAADLRLQSNFGLQTWNSIRALDFLLTHPTVDAKRIGVTGASGGGTQSMILSAIDARIAAAFPCVMISTAMQGGCTCENASYLRIGQGNIDIAAATAPRPLGMTAADDWTRELETKGFPDLKHLYTVLGKPDNVMATFHIHWKHNYNHVSRTSMYGFMNDHFQLGFSKPVLEREFEVATRAELTVWTEEHPAPTGAETGDLHEKALLRHWAEDSDQLLAAEGGAAIRRRAWELMVGREAPAPSAMLLEPPAKQERGDHLLLTSTLRDTRYGEDVRVHHLYATQGWSGKVILWLSDEGLEAVGEAGRVNQRAQELISAGHALVVPEWYLMGAESAPRLAETEKDPHSWKHSACYTYGYNPTLFAHRVHDAMLTLVSLRHQMEWPVEKVLVVGDGMGATIAAVASVLLPEQVDALAVGTGGFRFATLKDQYHPMFVPGAVKYGDLPGLLRLCAGMPCLVAGEGAGPASLTTADLLALLR